MTMTTVKIPQTLEDFHDAANGKARPMASDMTIQVQGTLTPDGRTIVLDAKPALPPGRVSVRVEPLEASTQGIKRSLPPGYFDLIGVGNDETLMVHPQPPMPPALEID